MKDRDSRLYKWWLEHPDMSFQNIGNVFHIKHRQQVFVIIKREKELAGEVETMRMAGKYTPYTTSNRR